MSIILRHGILEQGDAIPTIETDKASITLPWQTGDYSDYCAVNVTPDSMSITITKSDTGDGTAWANIIPDTSTGDVSFRARAVSDNSTGLEKSMLLTITDDASEADSVQVTLYQEFEVV